MNNSHKLTHNKANGNALVRTLAILLGIAGIAILGYLAFYSTQKPNDRLAELLKVSGLSDQVASIPSMIRSMADQPANPQDPEGEQKKAKALSTIDQHFAPQLLIEAIEKRASGQLTDPEIGQLLHWYNSDIGKRFVAAELAVSNERPNPETIDKALSNLSDKNERTAMGSQVESLLNTTDTMIGLQQYLAFAAIKHNMPNATSEQTAPILAQIRKGLDQIKPSAQKAAIQGITYAYRDIPMADLKQYLAFLQHPVTAKFYQASDDAMKETVYEQINAWMGASASKDTP